MTTFFIAPLDKNMIYREMHIIVIKFTKKTVRGDGIHEGTIYRIPSGGDQEHIQMNSRHSSPEFEKKGQ
ncbi:UNVERIFIED_CONTAM: hypothetical protein NCL1_07977 [Trichonephila clavipes]